MYFSFRLPLRFLRGDYTRLTLSVIALALGVALVCAIDLCNQTVRRAFVEVVDGMAGRAALQVTAGAGSRVAENLVDIVEQVTGVDLAVPVVSAAAFMTDGSGEQLTVHGVDIADENSVRIYEGRNGGGIEIDDPLVFLNQPDSILLTRAFADRRHLSPGDTLTLDTPRGRHTFSVRGLLEPSGVAQVLGGNLLVMDLQAAQQFFTGPGLISRIDIVVGRDQDVSDVARAIQERLPSGMTVETPAQRKADLHRVMRSLETLLRGVGLIGLAAAFLIAFNRLSTVFEARAWQIGVVRAVGVRQRLVLLELLAESILVGVVGTGLGIPLGIAVGWLMLPAVTTVTSLNYKLPAFSMGLEVSTWSVLVAAFLGIIAALFAAVAPAWRVSRVSLAETIGSRGREQRAARASRSAILCGAVAAMAAATIAFQAATRQAEWGLFATVLIAVFAALVSRPLLAKLLPALAGLLTDRVGPTLRFAVARLAHNPRRAGLTVAMLAVGLGTVFWVGIIGYSFRSSVAKVMPGVLRGDLIVSSTHIASGVMEAPVSGELISELRALPGIGAVVGHQAVDWDHEGGPIAINAFDPIYFSDDTFGHWPLIGSSLPDVREVVASGTAVLVSTNFVVHLGARVGDDITLQTPSGPAGFRIAGVTADFLSPRGTIEMSREVYQRLWKDNQIVHALVRLIPGADLDEVRTGIAASLGARYGLRILTARQLVAHFEREVDRAFVSLDVLAGLALVVLLVGMTDTLAASVLERTRELGTMRAVGGRRKALGLAVITEGILLGTFGLALALAFGVGLGMLWVWQTFPFLLGWVLELRLPVGRVVLVASLTLLVCLGAALIPARRAGRLDAAVALRYE